MIRNYVKMLLGFPILLFAGNCCSGAQIEDVEINAHLTVDEQISLTTPDTNITLSRESSGSAYGINNIEYAGLSGEFILSSNIHNPQYKIQCTAAKIDTQSGRKQNYQSYIYQNGAANTANDIMQQKVVIRHDSNDASNTAKFQLLFVLPNNVNYQTGSHSSTTTCTISST